MRAHCRRTNSRQSRRTFPAVGKLIKGFQTQIAKFSADHAVVKQTTDQVAQERARTVAEQVQDAIDGNAKLAHLQAEAGDNWQLALQYDAMLQKQARWHGKSFAERFEKVVALVEADVGRGQRSLHFQATNPGARRRRTRCGSGGKGEGSNGDATAELAVRAARRRSPARRRTHCPRKPRLRLAGGEVRGHVAGRTRFVPQQRLTTNLKE
jgi:hypothetical protein